MLPYINVYQGKEVFSIILNIKENVAIFEKHIRENYDMEVDKIYNKFYHTLRVMKHCIGLAKKKGLAKEKIYLASLIGLLHDIGTFLQITENGTYVAIGITDHGDLGVNILFEQGLIREFLKTTEYDEIIKAAVKNHNKAAIDPDLDEESRLFAQILRDADKLDIFYIITDYNPDHLPQQAVEKGYAPKGPISPKIWDALINHRTMTYADAQSYDDEYLIHTAGYIVDVNFSETFEYIRELKYIDKIFKHSQSNNPKMDEAYRIISDFINEKIGNLETSSSFKIVEVTDGKSVKTV